MNILQNLKHPDVSVVCENVHAVNMGEVLLGSFYLYLNGVIPIQLFESNIMYM